MCCVSHDRGEGEGTVTKCLRKWEEGEREVWERKRDRQKKEVREIW